MSNIHILAISPTDDGSFSGGSWNATYPLTNLVDQQPKTVARSSNALAASTLFVVDCGSSQSFKMFAFVNNNFSSASTVRIRVSPNSNGSSPTLDTTVDGNDPDVVWGSLPWGAFPWDGQLDELHPGGPTMFYLHTATVAGRYVLIDVTDTGNADGYVELGRFMAGVPFVPELSPLFGGQFGLVDESRVSRAAGGSLYADVRLKRRRVSVSFPALTESEALSTIYNMQDVKGISHGIVVVWDPEDDIGVLQRRTFYGTLTSLAPLVLQNQSPSPYSWQAEIEELV